MRKYSREVDVLIVGGGQAGAQAAIALRSQKYDGSIEIVGAETDLPYERPPLSKDYLSGAKTLDRILIRPETFWKDRSIRLTLGREVIAIHPDEHTATLDDGSCVRYAYLIWAAGGRARRLGCEGGDLDGVHTLRTRSDADALAADLSSAQHVVIVGGGFVGLEAAAVAAGRGLRVSLFEAQDRLLARMSSNTVSRFYEAEHRRRGVEIRLGVEIERINGRDGRVHSVSLRSGEQIECNLVLVGIGIIPNVAPLEAAGATLSNGVWVDEFCRTSLPDIFAIGDCAAHLNRFAGGAVVRLESVQNANDQAITVARVLTGQRQPYDAHPWFWSDQYDLKMQTIGLATGHDATVVRGDPAQRSFSVIYLRDGYIVAIDCINTTKDYVQARKWIGVLRRPDQIALNNAEIPINMVPNKEL